MRDPNNNPDFMPDPTDEDEGFHPDSPSLEDYGYDVMAYER
jgi:hypothetical protein